MSNNPARRSGMSEEERELREEAKDILNEGEGTADPERDFHLGQMAASNTGDVTDPIVEYEREHDKHKHDKDEK